MPTSSIADEITRLSACRNDILSAISAKGVTVPVGSVLSSCPSLIASIPTGGGGGDPTSMINSGFVGTGAITYVRPFTATQKSVPVYDTATSAISCSSAYVDGGLAYLIKQGGSSWFNLNGSSPNKLRFSGTKESWASLSVSGTVTMCSTRDVYNGSAVGAWSCGVTGDTFTAEASFTALSNSNTEYLILGGLPSWSVTASTSVTGTTYVQTGSALPYPLYPTATEGNVSSYISAIEYWVNNGYYRPQFNISGNNSAIYTDGPTTSTPISDTIGLTTFSTFYTSNNIRSKLTPLIVQNEDTGYNYSYGAVASSYAGYTGA